MPINKKNKKRLLILLVLLAVPLLLNLLLYVTVGRLLGSSHISFVDASMILFEHKDPEIFSLWNPNNLGYIYSLFVSANFYSRIFSFHLIKLTHSTMLMQLIYYSGISIVTYYSTYFIFYKLQKLMFSSRDLLTPAVAAFFYSYNLAIILSVGIIGDIFHIILIAPYLIYLLIHQFINGLKLKHVLLQAFLIALITNNPPFSLAFLITMYIPFIFLKTKLFQIDNLKKYALIALVVLSAGSFFIFNLIYAYLNISRNVFYAPPVSQIDFIFLEKGIIGIFQFLYDWSISLYYSHTEPHPYYHYYFGVIGLTSTFFIWTFSLIAVVANWKVIRGKKALLFIIGCLVTAIFFIKGNQFPFGDFNMFLYKINPIMGIFRTPGSKFGVPIMLYLSILILISLNISKSKFISIPLIVAIFLHTLIYFNPYRYVGFNTSKTVPYATAVPQEYFHVSKILNESSKEGSIFFYPGINNGYFAINQTRFLSQDILGKLITRPLIYTDDTTMRLSKKIITLFSTDLDPKLAGMAGIRYVLIRKDYDLKVYSKQINYKEKDNLLVKNKYLKIYESPRLILYEVPANYYKNIISLNKPAALEYQKLSSYKYKIKTTSKGLEDNTLIFRNSYHIDWQIQGLDTSKYTVDHLPYDGFANSWQIKKRDDSTSSNESVELTIYFKSQNTAYTFGGVSLLTLLSVGGYLAVAKNGKK